MIGLIIKFLPYIFVFYFLVRFMKEPIYLLGIPFMLFLRQSIFIDKAYIFIQPGSLDTELIFLGWFLIVWLSISLKSYFRYETNEKYKSNKQRFNYQDYIMISLIVITSYGLVMTLKEYYVIEDVYTQYFTFLSLFLGYFMIKDILRYSNLQVLSEFLYNIVIINSIASFFYLLHQGFHINIYGEGLEYSSLDFQGELITRSFWFMPVLWFFSISYLLVFKRSKSIINIFLLTINMLGVFISYTRSFLIIAIILFILYFLLTGLRNKNLINSIKSIVLVCIAGLALFLAVSSFLPASTNYFLDRFKELDKKTSNAESNNLIYRFQRTGGVIDRIDSEKVIFGYGSVTEKQMPIIRMIHEITADMVWTGVVFRWGYVGLALFILLYVSSIVKAFFLFMKTEGILSQMALLFLLTILSQIIESFISWTFMSPDRSAMALWYFGMLTALLIANKNQDILETKIQSND